ncbi:MAG: hypothetical protein ACE5JP_09105 [Candidatus Bipolaricaulia bacterium]
MRYSCVISLALALWLVAGAASTSWAHGGSGSGTYINKQQVGPYRITVHVEMPTEDELGQGESANVSVQVWDAETGDRVTDASVVAIAGLRDRKTGELITVGPYQALNTLNQLGLYTVLLPVNRLGPWVFLISTSRDSGGEGKEKAEVHFQLNPGSGGFPWLPVGLGAGISLALGIGLFLGMRGRRSLVHNTHTAADSPGFMEVNP